MTTTVNSVTKAAMTAFLAITLVLSPPLAEVLASRGYLVAAVDHAYESVGTAFPGGRVLTCVACTAVEGRGREGGARVAAGRAQDVAFLLDQLTAWRYAAMIDRCWRPDAEGVAAPRWNSCYLMRPG